MVLDRYLADSPTFTEKLVHPKAKTSVAAQKQEETKSYLDQWQFAWGSGDSRKD